MNRFKLNAATYLSGVLAVLSLLTVGTAVGKSDHAAPASLVNARQHFFGAENVDSVTGDVRKDRVIFSWMTNASVAVSLKGRVFLMNSYINRLETTRGRTPIVIEDVVDLHPEAILLGHGHSDHASNAAYLSGTLNIPIYTSPETCDAMQVDAARIFGAGHTVNCIPLVPRDPSGTGVGDIGQHITKLDFLEPLACVTVFKHLHSAIVPPDPTVPFVLVNIIADPRDAAMYPVGTPRTGLETSTGIGGPVSLFYQFVLRGSPNFTFVWHDTIGPVKERAPQVFDILDALPKTDVEFGSIISLGNPPPNGVRDTVLFSQHLKPKIYIPIHLTDATLLSSSPEWRIAYLKQLDVMNIPQSQRPEPRWLVDPLDYLRPLVYDPKDDRWGSNKGESDEETKPASNFCRDPQD